jgi:serine/threonine protein kinase
MECPDLIGQVLDGKYQMNRELGRGGMGAVYLATHLGTERPVAVKVIAPQFMQRTEFIERFRREARAAGRLRHPNVVNVTDFGFSESSDGNVAYLVMEYLDGCTLGEILEEEKNLPVGWTLDILEQVCSAVHEAHLQGIIHRDLKPDNIWLEPNQRGGYTVKVLDFGIAKLEEQVAQNGEAAVMYDSGLHTMSEPGKTTIVDTRPDGTMLDASSQTQVPESHKFAAAAKGGTQLSEAGTVIQLSPISEGETAILTETDDVADQRVVSSRSRNSTGHSLLDSSSSGELTRVGAVLGTPLYMSPEQCRGEHLDPRSDIYSLGIIAYQMLSGRPPFEGDFKDVMEAHKTIEPMPLKAKRVRRKMKRGIHSALSKDPDRRPQTAEAFASELRARSEGIFGLLRRSMTIYTEHLSKFVLLSAFFSLPMVVLTLALLAASYLKVSEMVSDVTGNITVGLAGFALTIVSPFCANLILGTIAWIVTQHLAVPLRPLRLRPALKEARRKWKRFAGAGLLTTFLPFVAACVGGIGGFLGLVAFGLMIKAGTGLSGVAPAFGIAGAVIGGLIGFFIAYISCILVAPVVMMENRKIIDSVKRSRALVKRSFWTAFGAVCILIFIPAIIAGSISYVVNVSAKAFDPTLKDAAPQTQVSNPDGTKEIAITTGPEADAAQAQGEKQTNIGWFFNKKGIALSGTGKDMDMKSRVKFTVLESINQILWLPAQILVFSFSAIIIALLYMKTRLAGGESIGDLIERFEDDGRPRKKWQERVRARLIQSGRIPSKP